MAKASSPQSRAKGKLGGSVYYTIANSNNADKQGIREYKAEISNPQSEGQRAQRMKLAPANAFYRALRELLNHSWEGVRYRARSHSYFMKQALGSSTLAWPFVPKGYIGLVPGTYPVSRGSLIGANVTGFVNASGANAAVSDINLGAFSFTAEGVTFGQLSAAIVSNNPAFQNGDQITFVVVKQFGDSYIPAYYEMVLDTTSLQALGTSDLLRNVTLSKSASGNYLQFTVGGADLVVVGAAIIQSRKSTTSASGYLRSTTDLTVANSIFNLWMTVDAYNAALATYKNGSGDSVSEWYLNQANNTTAENGIGQQFKQSVVTNENGLIVGAAAQVIDGDLEAYGKFVAVQSGSQYYGFTLSGRTLMQNSWAFPTRYTADYFCTVADLQADPSFGNYTFIYD